jgi:hypothetical protein
MQIFVSENCKYRFHVPEYALHIHTHMQTARPIRDVDLKQAGNCPHRVSFSLGGGLGGGGFTNRKILFQLRSFKASINLYIKINTTVDIINLLILWFVSKKNVK